MCVCASLQPRSALHVLVLKIITVCWMEEPILILPALIRNSFSKAFVIVMSLCLVVYFNKVSFGTLGLLCFIKCVWSFNKSSTLHAEEMHVTLLSVGLLCSKPRQAQFRDTLYIIT